jgi:hypothetical protein
MSPSANRFAVFVASLALNALSAQTPVTKAAAPAKKTAVSARPRETPPRKPALPDGELEKQIRARFEKSKISVENFQVRVQGGIATIDGKTAVVQRKGTATRLARLAGARSVVNRIEVSEAARRKAAENLAEGRRRVQVKRSER